MIFAKFLSPTEETPFDRFLPPTTAGTKPEIFSDDSVFSRRAVRVTLLIIFILLGFGLRVVDLGTESLGEDEFNKVQTVRDYRQNGISGRNGEHPFLMKGLQTASFIVAEQWNNAFAPSNSAIRISDEAAVRFPTALFGTFTALLLYLLAAELFGSGIGLIAAGLYAVDPSAIGFDRIAKEDGFLLFFFLLANVFFLREQSAVERGAGNSKYFYLAAAAFGAMVAAKYLPHLIGISAAYYLTFDTAPNVRWRLNKYHWLSFLAVVGIAFVVCNPTILLPDTWREMMTFAGEKRIGHDSYEFCGQLYRNQMTAWLSGVPWTFYYVFIAVKTPLLSLAFFLAGLILMWRRRMGDGRYFVFFWAFMWFMPFSVLGGKFTRYFALAEPIVLLSAAVGFYFFARWLTTKAAGLFSQSTTALSIFQMILLSGFLSFPLIASLTVTPHYRLYTNALGGGMSNAGTYFPHDEFYDTSTREAIQEIAARARPNAVVANETPALFQYYAEKSSRADLQQISLAEKAKIQNLAAGDFIVAAEGRRYFSNSAYLNYLKSSVKPVAEIKSGQAIAARIYQLDENTAPAIRELAK